MKIVKDSEGYFVLDNANQKVMLHYRGEIIQKFPTIFHIGLAHWAYNEKGNIVTTPFEVLIDGDRSFKSLKYSIFKYAAGIYELGE